MYAQHININHYHHIKMIHISICNRVYQSLFTQSPLKAEDEVYAGVAMGYGTIMSNGAAHGYKAQNQNNDLHN